MFYLFMLLIFSSCNQENTENQVNELKKVIEEQELIINDLQSKLSKLNQWSPVSNKTIKYTDDEIIDIVKKHEEYYCPEGIRKNFVVRRLDENTCDVRYELKFNNKDDFSITIKRIEFTENHRYTISHYKGYTC